VKNLLPFLAAQPGHYITVHIHGFPYLVQEGDQIRLPFRMPGVLAGDVLRLNRASVIGSRDYTMKGAPHIDERVFECRATVLGVESEPMRIKIKKKRRQRRKRQAKSKHRYTILRISELNIKDLDDVE
jgi:ribosomal protein L21